MHRTISVSVPAHLSNQLTDQLQSMEGVISMSVYPNASLKPPGNVLSVQVLNRDSDEMLRRVREICTTENFSIATAEQTSFIDPAHEEVLADDVDAAIWEEMETGLRHHGRITPN